MGRTRPNGARVVGIDFTPPPAATPWIEAPPPAPDPAEPASSAADEPPAWMPTPTPPPPWATAPPEAPAPPAAPVADAAPAAPLADAAPPAWSPASSGVATLPAYDAPAPPPGAFPAPPFPPPARARRNPRKLAGAVVLAIAVTAGAAQGTRSLTGDSDVSGAAKPAAKPAAGRLSTPARVGGYPRMTMRTAKEFEQQVKQSAPDQQPVAAWYGSGTRVRYEVIALAGPAEDPRAVLRKYTSARNKDRAAKFSAVAMQPGGNACSRMSVKRNAGSVCSWSTKRSTGVMVWYGSNDVRALGKVATQVRRSIEG